MEIWQIILLIIVILAVIFFAFVSAVAKYLYEFAIDRRGKKNIHTEGKSPSAQIKRENPEQSASILRYTPEMVAALERDGEEIFIQSEDGLRLRAYEVMLPGSHDYAILCHGYLGNLEEMIRFGEEYRKRGFSVLLPDIRAHGKSEGTDRCMGWLARKDMLLWIDRAVRRDPQARVLLFGISMGGALVMMTGGEKLPPQVRGIIEDCGYTSAWDEFAYQVHDMFHLPVFPCLYAAGAIVKRRAGYRLKEASAVEQLKKCHVPMLFIHGGEDRFVPPWMLDKVYDAAAGPKEKLLIPGAGHARAAVVDPARYWQAVDRFLAAYFPKEGENGPAAE